MYFNPRPPRGGRPPEQPVPQHIQTISIHAPREGGDTGRIFHSPGDLCISIHAPREGGDRRIGLADPPRYISIHAPREGGDGTAKESIAANEISIHAPREGGDCQRALASHR